MADVIYPQGTTEYAIIAVDDKLDNLSDGAWLALTPKYDVKNQAGTFLYTQANALTDLDAEGEFGPVGGKIARCMVDTDTTGPTTALWPAGVYRIYLDIPTPPEVARVGPYEFEVSAA